MVVHAYLRYALGGGLVVVRHQASQAVVRFCRPMLAPSPMWRKEKGGDWGRTTRRERLAPVRLSVLLLG